MHLSRDGGDPGDREVPTILEAVCWFMNCVHKSGTIIFDLLPNYVRKMKPNLVEAVDIRHGLPRSLQGIITVVVKQLAGNNWRELGFPSLNLYFGGNWDSHP